MASMPKRRKCKDNPYTIIYCEESNKYFCKFKDSKNNVQIIELTLELYKAFNDFELEDISFMHKVDKYIERSELYEETLYNRSFNKMISIEEQVEYNDEILKLKLAIDRLPGVQKRRLKMYYFDNLSLERIAKIEGCSFQAISKCIILASKNLKEILKKINF